MHIAQRPHIAPQNLKHAQDQVGYHLVIAHRWYKYFEGDIFKAAESWFTYSQADPTQTIEHWFGQFDPSVLPKEEDARWKI
jgi:hypothetical protein